MKQVLIKKGQAVVEDVPAPLLEDNSVLVGVQSSCISTGTEMSGLKTSSMPLWKKAIRHPEKIKKVLDMTLEHGVSRTNNIVQGKIETGSPTGYSAAGVVIGVGKDVHDFQIGDRVACAGAQCAHHAEVIRVPQNLTVQVPKGLDIEIASTVTLGAIALQGVRRAQPTLGETFVVLGLGVLGQLTAQLLRANGCRVIGTDLDRRRIQQALDLGMEVGIHPDDGNNIEQVSRFTHGFGADGVIITAATPSNEVISTAFQMCRKKGRVVLVGDVGLNLNRGDFYQKELDFYISTSYGPGRYDQNYEEEGLDYPISYIRWTENRNMGEYLRLIQEEKLKVSPLISGSYPVEEATKAYEAIKNSKDTPLMVLLSYPQAEADSSILHKVTNPLPITHRTGQIKVAMVGAGGFAKGMHLPNLQKLSNLYHLQAVVSRTGQNAIATAKLYGASYASTDYQEVLDDSEVDAVFICTRHDLHAGMTLAALQAGKHVLVEKPLALTQQELEKIQAFYDDDYDKPKPILLTGFNRRFSPHAQCIYQAVSQRSNPMVMNYRMNAGYIPLDSWVHGDAGGGRNRGEACHIYDLFTFLTNSQVNQVTVHSVNPTTAHYSNSDNFIATFSFADGSVANLIYSALGSSEFPKENLEVFVDGKVYVLEDYKGLKCFGSKFKGLETKVADKGHQAEIEAFAQAIKAEIEWPIPLWQQMQATEMALQVQRQLDT